MRIIYICGDTGVEMGGRKGAATHARETCHALMRFGHDVLVLAAAVGDSSQIRAAVIEVRAPQSRWLGADLRYIILNRRMRRELERAIAVFKPDAVYERYSLYQTAGQALCRKYRIPRILEVNTLLAREQEARLHWPGIAARIERALWRREKAVVVVSQTLKRLFIEAAQLDESQMAGIIISPVAVDEKVFHAQVTPVETAGLVPEGKRIAGYMGTLTAWHGVDLFFEAARILRDENLPVAILAVGGEDERVERMRQKVREQGLEANLVFYGSIPYNKVPSYLAAMDVCLIADTQDWSSPTKFFEFAAMERPIVAARSPAVQEVLGANEPRGLLFERGNARDMVEKIMLVIRDPELAARLGKAARRRVLENHTWACNIRAMMELYQKLGARGATPPPETDPDPTECDAATAGKA